MASRNGGQIVVDQLRHQGVGHLFCVPGESFLPILVLDEPDDLAPAVLRAAKREGPTVIELRAPLATLAMERR
jgi:acetolactate synthase-1/2/3 large subunit